MKAHPYYIENLKKERYIENTFKNVNTNKVSDKEKQKFEHAR